MNTLEHYEQIIGRCSSLFEKKAKDYGTSWTILRLPSVTDQIGIKADRIRTLQETNENKVGDSIESEFIGIVNYCIIALMLMDLNTKGSFHDYLHYANICKETMLKKNHDYGEAWRKMRVASITDLILMKILRIKQIEDNNHILISSEGVDANYIDILNYAVFCLIKME